jgi:hypothetical protein
MPTASARPTTISGSLNQKPPHGFSRCAKEMPPAVPVLRFGYIHESEINLVYQRRRLECLIWFLMAEPGRSQFPQFPVHERQQFLSGAGIALLNLAQDLRDVTHQDYDTAPWTLMPASEFALSTARAHG